VTVHTIFDFLAWLSAALMGLWIQRRGWLSRTKRPTLSDHPGYFVALSLGAVAGAIALGGLNLGLANRSPLGHSIAGAIFGGIIAVELYKRATGMTGSTGVRLVAPLALGVAVGRLGCFFSGLPDYTYGVSTTLPWGVDLGDGIVRHPVQLYESAAMLAFLAAFLAALAGQRAAVVRQGFYLFVAWYGTQRFVWEFLKPYPTLVGPLNLFHFVSIALVAYSIIMLRQSRDLPAPA
jgi:phosphatidylglycerol---prolipoprotein diacylglyceryl transferase